MFPFVWSIKKKSEEDAQKSSFKVPITIQEKLDFDGVWYDETPCTSYIQIHL